MAHGVDELWPGGFTTVAVVALARKLGGILYAMWRDESAYDAAKQDGSISVGRATLPSGVRPDYLLMVVTHDGRVPLATSPTKVSAPVPWSIWYCETLLEPALVT